MISRLDRDFVKQFGKLPKRVQDQARQTYEVWQSNPEHPGLAFKQIHATLPIYSVRVGIHYRAIGIKRTGDVMLWFFIGSHADYDNHVKRLRQ